MKTLVCFIIGLFTIAFGFSQEEDPSTQRKEKIASDNYTYEANTALTDDNFIDAETSYRKAISKSDKNTIAKYNMGNAYYRENSLDEAFIRYKQAGEAAQSKVEKHKTYHNMGNVFMKNKDYEKAVEAYKEALRNDPADEETRYNLALAKEMLKKDQDKEKNDQNKDDQKKDQQNQDQNQKDKDKEGEQEEDKDQGDNKDQGKDQQKEDNKEGEGDKKPEDQDQKEGQSKDEKEKKQPPPRPNQLSPQQIKNILDAMNNEEKKVQEKMNAKKVKGVPVKSEKDW